MPKATNHHQHKVLGANVIYGGLLKPSSNLACTCIQIKNTGHALIIRLLPLPTDFPLSIEHKFCPMDLCFFKRYLENENKTMLM